MEPIIIPTANPKASFLKHRDRIQRAVERVLESGFYVLGSEVKSFEREFADFMNTGYAVGVGSGTEALHLALVACGVSHGDVVFTASHTAVATVAAIELAGATPFLVDIDPVTYTISVESLEEGINEVDNFSVSDGIELQAKAVIPVHLYGHPADMKAIMEIAEHYNLFVIEDCAQSHGASLNGRLTGTWGHVGAFSFYPTKNLGALGDGGALVTEDETLAQKARLLRQYGWAERYVSLYPGLNSRLDELQAAILRVKLQFLEEENKKRRHIAVLYDEALSNKGLDLPHCAPGVKHAYHQYVIRSASRDSLRRFLKKKGVGTAIHYAVPVHRQPAYDKRVPRVSSMANTEELVQEIISLPIYPELTLEEIHIVSDLIGLWCSKQKE
jgi:dTDP-4-amino-4,6-dideoxygalactose transaminase